MIVEDELLTHPIIIVEDRYGGVYSDGKWIAVAKGTESCRDERWQDNVDAIFEDALADDVTASNFWCEVRENPDKFFWIVVGNTPDNARQNLLNSSCVKILREEFEKRRAENIRQMRASGFFPNL
jgi:hypothetical protein